MPNLGYGIIANGNTALRLAYSNATNLRTASKDDLSLWKFDSETAKLGYLYDIASFSLSASYPVGSGYAEYYFPAGSTFTTATSAVMWNFPQPGQNWNFFLSYYSSYFGYLPLMESRVYNGGVFTGPNLLIGTSAPGVAKSVSAYVCTSYLTGRSTDPVTLRECNVVQFPHGDPTSRIASTFELPMRSDALPNYAATPVSGQQTILINPSVARIALPGRTVSDPDPRHYIMHEDRIPAKIMAAGDINVPASGTATITTPLPVTALTYMDFHVKLASQAEFWNPPYFDISLVNYGFTYVVSGNSVVITNTAGVAITVRYVIFADDDSAHTTGGSDVFRKGNDGTRDYLQIKRPGSSDTAPNLNDIMVDSRLAYMPLVKEGFLPWPSGFPTAVGSSNRFLGERAATVSFANPNGFKSFVKQVVVLPNTGGGPNAISAIGGWHSVFINSGATWSGRTDLWSSAANLHSTSVDFYMSGDNPSGLDPSNGNPQYPGNYPALGLRYYIFAIPASL